MLRRIPFLLADEYPALFGFASNSPWSASFSPTMGGGGFPPFHDCFIYPHFFPAIFASLAIHISIAISNVEREESGVSGCGGEVICNVCKIHLLVVL